MKEQMQKAIQFLLNPRLVLCFLVAWMITNGWSYILLAVGTYFRIHWMIAVSTAYLTWLWLPVSPEKLATFAIAILFLKLWFPKDQKTLAVLEELREKTRAAFQLKKKNTV